MRDANRGRPSLHGRTQSPGDFVINQGRRYSGFTGTTLDSATLAGQWAAGDSFLLFSGDRRKRLRRNLNLRAEPTAFYFLDYCAEFLLSANPETQLAWRGGGQSGFEGEGFKTFRILLSGVEPWTSERAASALKAIETGMSNFLCLEVDYDVGVAEPWTTDVNEAGDDFVRV